jgi:peptidoglycan/LPS O-acetylase OafA/YrhL
MYTTHPSTLPVPSLESVGLPSRILMLDVFRGVACAWVLLHHSLGTMPLVPGLLHIPGNILGLTARTGWLGVSLFLVLSGFCLYYPLVRLTPHRPHPVPVGPFLLRRCQRLVPAYLAALGLGVLLGLTTNFWGAWDAAPISMLDLLSHLLLIHNLSPATFNTINGALWSLALEFQLYLLFPMLVAGVLRYGMARVLLLTFVVATLWQLGCWMVLGGWTLAWGGELATAYHALPARCFEFVAGMAAAQIVVQPSPQARRRARWSVLLLTPGALLLVMAYTRFGILLDQTWGVIFASLIVVILTHPGGLPIPRLLVWIGVRSYSIYLIHQPLNALLTPPSLAWGTIGRTQGALLGLGRIAVLVILGWGFWLLVERPALQFWSSWRLRRLSRPARGGDGIVLAPEE